MPAPGISDNLNPKHSLHNLQANMVAPSKYHVSEEQMSREQEQITAAKKNPALFEPLYNKYYEQVFRFCYQRLDDKETAFDVTSQVFLKAMTNLHKYEYRGVPFGSWLFRIAYSEVNQLYRNNKAMRTLNVETDRLADMMDEMKEEGREEQIELMIDKLALLEADDLSLIEMRFFEKRAFKEIGDILGITENNAKVKTYRALDKLRKFINPDTNK